MLQLLHSYITAHNSVFIKPVSYRLMWVFEEYLVLSGDWVDLVMLHQLVERGELLRPQVILPPAVSQHLEVLDVSRVSAAE